MAEQEQDESRTHRLRQHARWARDYQWRFMERVAAVGTLCLWFTPWNKDRRPEASDEWRAGLLVGNDLLQWMQDHPDWFIVGEWDAAREARPITLTAAGHAALADRVPWDMAPFHGGLVEPGWTAIPLPLEARQEAAR